MSDCVWPHRRQPTRLPHPWDSPGKNTGVGCHFLLQCMKVKIESEVAQSCPTLSDSMDCSPPGSSVHGIFQARVLEWAAIAFSTYTYWSALISSPLLPTFGVVLCLSQMWLKKLHPFQFCLTVLLPGFSVTRWASSILLTMCGLVQTNFTVSRPLHCLETYTLIAEISQFLCSQSFHLINRMLESS